MVPATILSCLLTESTEFANYPPRNPPTQTQQISKSIVYLCCMIKYTTRGGVSWQTQHSASPRAVFATLPHPSCCVLSYSTRNSALTSICRCVICFSFTS